MQQIKVSEADPLRRRVPFFLVNSAGAPVLNVTNPTRTITKNGDATDVGGEIWTQVGLGGVYSCQLSQGQVSTVGFLSIHVVDTQQGLALTQAEFIQVVGFDPYTVQPNPNVNVASWSALTVPATVVDFANAYRALAAVAFEATMDKYTAVWADKAGPRMELNGVTGATISIHDRNGVAWLTDASMTSVPGVPGSFKINLLDGSGGRIPEGESRIVTFKAMIDGTLRTYREAFTRELHPPHP